MSDSFNINNYVYSRYMCICIYWRRKWQPTPVFLPRKFRGQRSLAGYSPWVAEWRSKYVEKHIWLSWLKSRGISFIQVPTLYGARSAALPESPFPSPRPALTRSRTPTGNTCILCSNGTRGLHQRRQRETHTAWINRRQTSEQVLTAQGLREISGCPGHSMPWVIRVYTWEKSNKIFPSLTTVLNVHDVSRKLGSWKKLSKLSIEKKKEQKVWSTTLKESDSFVYSV